MVDAKVDSPTAYSGLVAAMDLKGCGDWVGAGPSFVTAGRSEHPLTESERFRVGAQSVFSRFSPEYHKIAKPKR